jgi:vacuolar-type H+-ATPase subunit C/Vma6
MNKGGRAYTCAKAQGIIGHSFVGKNSLVLTGVSRLSELEARIFPDNITNLPEKQLLPKLQARIEEREVKAVLQIASACGPASVPEFLKLLVCSYEFNDLKNLVSAIENNEIRGDGAGPPPHQELGAFALFHFERWPDLKALLKGSGLEFILDKDGKLKKSIGDVPLLTVVDRYYYNNLWRSIKKLPFKDRQASESLLLEEISLQNAVWTLRMRTYYSGMAVSEIKNHLLVADKDVDKHSAAAWLRDADFCLNLPLDSFEVWQQWRRVGFLNPGAAGELWQADPRYFQNQVARYLYRRAFKAFHANPLSLDTLYAYVKLKQAEEDLLTGLAGGLALGMSAADVLSLLGVNSVTA